MLHAKKVTLLGVFNSIISKSRQDIKKKVLLRVPLIYSSCYCTAVKFVRTISVPDDNVLGYLREQHAFGNSLLYSQHGGLDVLVGDLDQLGCRVGGVFIVC